MQVSLAQRFSVLARPRRTLDFDEMRLGVECSGLDRWVFGARSREARAWSSLPNISAK